MQTYPRIFPLSLQINTIFLYVSHLKAVEIVCTQGVTCNVTFLFSPAKTMMLILLHSPVLKSYIQETAMYEQKKRGRV